MRVEVEVDWLGERPPGTWAIGWQWENVDGLVIMGRPDQPAPILRVTIEQVEP